jgi:hypothetical protein
MQPGYPPPPGYGYPPPGYPPPGYGYPPGYAPPPTKSTTPRTLGTLSIVFGALIAFLSLIGLVAGKQFGSMMRVQPSQRDAFNAYLHEVHGASMAISTLMLVMSLILVAVGIGQRGYRRWAVQASVAWGIAALVVLVINAVVQFTVMIPALDRFIAAITHGGRIVVPMGGIMKVSAIMGLVFYAPFPIILISAFRKAANVTAMDQPPLPVAETRS